MGRETGKPTTLDATRCPHSCKSNKNTKPIANLMPNAMAYTRIETTIDTAIATVDPIFTMAIQPTIKRANLPSIRLPRLIICHALILYPP